MKLIYRKKQWNKIVKENANLEILYFLLNQG